MSIGGGAWRRFDSKTAAFRLTMVVALIALAACSPAPSLLLSWNSPSQGDSAAPIDAQLTVIASGRVSCQFPLGCDALAGIQPVPAGVSPSASTISPSQQMTFVSLPTAVLGTWDVSAMPLGSPTRIPAGHYKVAGAVNTISDALPVVTTPVPVDTFPGCLVDLTVKADTSVTISIKFAAAGRCTIATAAVAEVDPPSPRPLGVVPASLMTVSVSNGTTLDVAVFVNGLFVTYLVSGSCAGCPGDDGIPAGVLPPLPWQVELRTPAGRVLLPLLVRAGDVVETDGGTKGDGNRVDLSCGRLDIWSGPPIDGPSPGAGSPGDCRP